MRWLFLFVFSLNLAYVAWEMNKSSVDDYANVPALKNAQTIVLLSELKQQADSVKAEAVRVDNASVASSSVVSADTEQADVGRADFEQVAAKPQEVVEKPEIMPVEVAKKSVASAEAVASAKQKRPAEVQPVKPSQTASCFTLGPFRDLNKLRGLTREIKSYVVEADFRGREERERTLHWVYIKPEKNRTKAIETGKRLKAKKIKDFYVIRDGEKVNGLSLGHFRNKDGAYGLAKKVKNLGFDVVVEPVFRTYTIYWLDYQLAGGVNIPESIFEKYVKQAKKGKFSRLRRDCDA